MPNHRRAIHASPIQHGVLRFRERSLALQLQQLLGDLRSGVFGLQHVRETMVRAGRSLLALLQEGLIERGIEERRADHIGELRESLQLGRLLAEEAYQRGGLRLADDVQLEERVEKHFGATQLLQNHGNVERLGRGAPGASVADLLGMGGETDLRTDDVWLDGEQENAEKRVFESAKIVVSLKSHVGGADQAVFVLNEGEKDGCVLVGDFLVDLHVVHDEAENVHFHGGRLFHLRDQRVEVLI